MYASARAERRGSGADRVHAACVPVMEMYILRCFTVSCYVNSCNYNCQRKREVGISILKVGSKICNR
uniref:Uncharacterized protein n=1 Tax=Trichogramma kaykai TaxID=54128 RepID=A0ABD2WUY1_9HYME